MGRYYCSNCGGNLEKQEGFVPETELWKCTECGKEQRIILNRKEKSDKNKTQQTDKNENDSISSEETSRNAESKEIIPFKENVKKKKISLNGKKNLILGIIIAVLLLIIVIMGSMLYKEKETIGKSPDEIVGKTYTEVAELLEAKGFTKIIKKEIMELSYEESNRTEEIQQIFVDGENDFKAQQKYDLDVTIVIYCLYPEKAKVPWSSDEVKNMDYSDIVAELKDLGFGNITVEPQYDLVFGWFNQENQIAEISINTENRFNKGREFPVDAKIFIKYHAFKE